MNTIHKIIHTILVVVEQCLTNLMGYCHDQNGCLIIFDNRRERPGLVEPEQFKRAAECNSDGMGIMHPSADGTRVEIFRTMTDLEGLYARYQAARAANKPVAVHFRKATSGTRDESNCHPFPIDDTFALMHNGVVFGMSQLIPEGWSDTHYLADGIIKHMPDDFLQRPGLRLLIETLVTGDRLLFMDNHGRYDIINEAKGDWFHADKDTDNGVWYSHKSTAGIRYAPAPTVISKAKNVIAGYKDRHRVHREASDDWYKSNQSKLRDKELLFDYGLHADASSQIHVLSKNAICNGLALWAAIDPGEINIERCRPAAVIADGLAASAGTERKVRGRVLFLSGEVGRGEIEMSDYALDGQYYKTRRQIVVVDEKGNSTGTIHAWMYLAHDDLSKNTMIGPVPFGNWNFWSPKRTADPTDDSPVVLEAESASNGTEAHLNCPLCRSFNTSVHANSSGSWMFCRNCDEETDLTPNNHGN